MEQQRFQVLDSWRGICALLVMAYHLPLASHFYYWQPIRSGHFGVEFFFVLSGFVIAHSNGQKLASGGYFSSFLIRRFGRIYPLHLVTLLALVVVEFAKLAVVLGLGVKGGETPFGDSSSLPALGANLLLWNGLGGFHDFTWNGPSWSISAEFYTYILFAFVVWAAGRRYVFAAAALVVAAFALLTWNSAQPVPRGTVEGEGLLVCIAGFFLGTVTYQLFRWKGPASAWFEPVALGAVALVFWDFLPRSMTLIVFAAFVYVFAGERGPLAKAFLVRPAQWAGMVSYSIYLVHYPVITTLNALCRLIQAKLDVTIFGVRAGDKLLVSIGGPWVMDALTPLYFVVVLSLSALTYRWIEKPCDLWFKNLARGLTGGARSEGTAQA